jgi:hypothetical protein
MTILIIFIGCISQTLSTLSFLMSQLRLELSISHSLAEEQLLTSAKRDKAVRIQPHNNGPTLENARFEKSIHGFMIENKLHEKSKFSHYMGKGIRKKYPVDFVRSLKL